jgi:hypothetical protein
MYLVQMWFFWGNRGVFAKAEHPNYYTSVGIVVLSLIGKSGLGPIYRIVTVVRLIKDISRTGDRMPSLANKHAFVSTPTEFLQPIHIHHSLMTSSRTRNIGICLKRRIFGKRFAS